MHIFQYMDKQLQGKDAEWEGFQHFYDHVEKHKFDPPLVQILHKPTPKPTLKSQKSKNSTQIKPHTQKFILPDITLINKNKVESEEKINLNTTQIKNITISKYAKIPILKYEEDIHYYGKIVYKGYTPRTSDSYLRSLKEADWSEVNQNKIQRMSTNFQFDSKFESGYLLSYNRVGDYQYDLYMRVDTNTKGHRQWYYFSIKNKEVGRIKLNIYRFKKPYSLYQRGMKPYILSKKCGYGWRAGGKNVGYKMEKSLQQFAGETKDNYILSFTYDFEYDGDEVFFAAGIPYTYTFLNKQLLLYQQTMNNYSSNNIKFTISNLTKSMCGLEIPLVSIEADNNKKGDKKYVIINARTHSGQSSSSWVMDGILNQLCSNKFLVQMIANNNVVFKIVPILNVDGVFMGNYRTGIVGDDFNRKFNSGKKQFFPQIHSLRKLVNECKTDGKVMLFLDLHGHSILKNSFIYGPSPSSFPEERLKHLPFILWEYSKYFKLSSCKLIDSKNKLETARIYFQSKENILSLTCQNSLGLYSQHKQSFQMLQNDWKSFGSSIAYSIYLLITADQNTMQKYILSNTYQQLNIKSSKDNRKKQIQLTRNPTEIHDQQHIEKQLIASTQIKLKPLQSTTRKRESSTNERSLTYQHNNNKPKDQQKIPFRRKSQIINKLPIELKQKIQTNLFKNSQQYRKNQQSAYLTNNDRSLTYDVSANINQVNNQDQNQDPLMEVILENLSEDYQSINDSDSSSQNLTPNQKKYLLEHIKIVKSNHIRAHSNQDNASLLVQEQICSTQKIPEVTHINGFREYHFKSIQSNQKSHKLTSSNLSKQIKKDPKRFKQFANKPVKQITQINDYNQQSNVLRIVQKKRLSIRFPASIQKNKSSGLQFKDKKIS